jgi:putative membrane-bound dehydrogenase-like protein
MIAELPADTGVDAIMKSILPLAVFLSLTGAALAQKNPDEALKAFAVAEGLQLELFASEPMFVNPTCIDVDLKGRVWVCESVNYRCDLRKVKRNRPEGDRLVVLEDTDGDGKADKAHTFYQEKDFIAPLGVAVAPYPDGKGQRVYVCHSPHIYVFEDKDGDLKADAAPKILLTGFKGYDHDHGVHGIHFGPDGKLYFSVGDQGVEKLSSSNGDIKPDKETRRQGDKERVYTTNRTDCQAGTMWRCKPDGTGLELLAHNFRNQYEPAVDSFGTMFTSDNDDDGNQQVRICYVMYGGNHGYWPRNRGDHHWHEDQPGVVHKVLRTGFGSPTGMCWYEGTALRNAFLALRPNPPGPPSRTGKGGESDSPSPLRGGGRGEGLYGLLLHTDAGPREVRCFVIKTKGAGYEAEHINLVTSTDNWFRPSDVCVAPDGSVFVSDWYDPGVGGHGMGDTTRGRVYRITPKGHRGYKVPDFDLGAEQGAIAALGSPNLSTQHLAAQLLEKKDPRSQYALIGVEGKKASEAVSEKEAAMYRVVRLSWLYNQNPMRTRDQEHGFLVYFTTPRVLHTDSLVLFARQIFGRLLGRDALEMRKKYIDGLLKNPNFATPSAYRERLIAVRDEEPGRTKEWIWELVKPYDGQDPFYLAAINIAVGTDPKRREIILADFEKHFPEWNDKTAKLVWELRPPAVIAKLDQKLADPKLTAEQKAFVLSILAVSDGIEPGLAMLRVLEKDQTPELRQQALKSLVQYLPAKWSALKKRPELEATVAKLVGDQATRLPAIELIAAAELETGADTLAQWAGDAKMDQAIRLAAVRGLAAFKSEGVINFLAKLIDGGALAKEAIEALGQMKTGPSITPLKVVVLDAKRSMELRHAAIAALASSRDGTRWLIEEHASKALPTDVTAEAGRLVRNSPHQDLRNRALIAFPAPGKIDPKKLPPITALVKRRGDPKQGEQVFRTNKDVGCIRCHSVRGVGGNIGPDLSMIGKKGSRENLFESIIQPDKAIADQFVQLVVLDKRGVTLSGLLVEETPEHVILRDGFGKDNKLLTKDIEEKARSKKSIMPDDAVAQLTEQELIDVVAYLETLKTPALSPESWHVLGPFDNGQNDAGLDKEYIPEPVNREQKSPVDLSATYDGKDGKVKWRTVRLGADGYVNLLAFYLFGARDTVSYLYREIDSPAEQEATILIGTDDGCKLWVNGKEVLSHRRHEAATPERDSVRVELKKGANAILLKINNGDGPHGFYFTLVSEHELKQSLKDSAGHQP